MSLQEFIELTLRGTERKLMVKVNSIEAVIETDTKSIVQVAGQFHRVEQSYEKVKELIGQDVFTKLLNEEK